MQFPPVDSTHLTATDSDTSWHFLILCRDQTRSVKLQNRLKSSLDRECRFTESSPFELSIEKLFSSVSDPPDVVIVSDELAESDDFDLLAELRKNSELPSSPVLVAMEGGPDRVRGRKMIRAGAQDYFDEKTISDDALAQMVESASERSTLIGERREEVLAFVAEFQRGLTRLTGVDEIMEYSTRMIATHMGLSHCTLFEITEAADEAITLFDHRSDGAIELKGRIPLNGFLTENEIRSISSGEAMWVDNVAKSDRPAEMKNSFLRLKLSAVANASHLADGRCKFLLHTSHAAPHVWRMDEIGLLNELSPNIYLRIERARIEEKLRASEARFRSTFDNLAIGLARIDLGGRWQRVNRAICKITGYPEDELRNLTFVDITHPDDLEDDLAQLSQLTEGEIDSYSMEKRYIRKNGSSVWVNITVSLVANSSGNPSHYVAAVEDVSAKREAQEELEKQRLFINRMTEVVPNVLYIFDLKKQAIVWINNQVVEALGYSMKETLKLASDFLPTLMHPDDVDAMAGHLERAAQTEDGVASSVEFRLKNRSGEWRWFKVRDTPFTRDDEGNVLELIGIAADVTARKQTERELRQAVQRKDEFLAMLGHELRNPLGAIRHAIALEKEFPDEEETRLWARDIIDRQSGQLSRMIEDLLDVARVTQGRISQLTDKVNLAEVIKRAAAVGRSLTDKGNLTLKISVLNDDLTVIGDAARLEQVFVNLLNNAAKYSSDGGYIHLVAKQEGDEAVVSIQDNGVGIQPEMLAGLFDLFHQVETTIDRSQGGLGIGLTVVKSLVEAHKGSVKAESDGPGHGSTFTVRLPLAIENEEQNEKRHSQPALTEVDKENAGSTRVLIVDDHKDAAQGLARLLTHRDCVVKMAHDGLEALELAGSFQPAVLLLDLGLPGIDGFELAKRLRAQDDFKSSLIIAISGYAQKSDREKSSRAGFDHHFAKPLEVREIIEIINAHDTSKE